MLQGINKHYISRKAGHNFRLLARTAPSRPQPLWTSSTYLHQIDEKELLFVGETDNGERICIKFVRRYSKAAHEKLCRNVYRCEAARFWRHRSTRNINPSMKEWVPRKPQNFKERLVELIKPTLAMYEMSTSCSGRMAHQVSCSSTLTGRGVIGEVRHPIKLYERQQSGFLAAKWCIRWSSDKIRPRDDITMFKRVFLPLLEKCWIFRFLSTQAPQKLYTWLTHTSTYIQPP